MKPERDHERQGVLPLQLKADANSVVSGRFSYVDPHLKAVDHRLSRSGVFGLKPPAPKASR